MQELKATAALYLILYITKINTIIIIINIIIIIIKKKHLINDTVSNISGYE